MIRSLNVTIRAAALSGAAAILGLATAATAATASSSLNVSATVTANCAVSTSPVAFGNVNTTAGTDVDGAGGITVTCTNGTDWSASAGVGSGTGATLASRKMASGSDLLSYSLFTDSARTSIWGDGTGSTAAISDTGTGAAQVVAVYGRVGLGQTSVPAGSYADTVAVTVTY